MALTVNSNLTNITKCEAGTWVDIGSGQGSGFDLDTFLEGTGARSRKVSNSTKGMMFDDGSLTDWSDRHVYIWVLIQELGILDTQANGGIRICLGESATAYTYWTIGGSENYFGGWKRYAIDTSRPATGVVGSPTGVTSCRYVGITVTTNANAGNLPTLVIDRMDYITNTSAVIQVEGGALGDYGDFSEIVAAETAASTNYYGIFREDNGVIFMLGGLEIGDSAGTSATFFSDNDKVIVPESPNYYNSVGSEVRALYPFEINVVGNTTNPTICTFGRENSSGIVFAPLTFKSSQYPVTLNFAESNVNGQNNRGTVFNKMRESNIQSSAESWNLACVGDTAGSLAGTYVRFDAISQAGVRTLYYAWHNNGTDPAVSGRTGVAITTTNGDSATTVATNMRAAIGAVADITTSGTGVNCIVTADHNGDILSTTNGDSPHVDTLITYGSDYNGCTWEGCQQIVMSQNTKFIDCTVKNTNAGDRLTFTTDFATENLILNTSASHGLSDGDKIQFEGSDLPDPLAEATDYFVAVTTTTSFAVNTTLAGALARVGTVLTDDGTGTNTYHPAAALKMPASVTGIDLKGISFVGNDEYAIEITTAGTYDFEGVGFSGNVTDILNSSLGAVIINITGGGDTPTVYNIGAGTSTVNNNVTTLVHVGDNTGANLENCRVFLEAANGSGPLPFEETVTITSSGTTATCAHTTHGLITGDKVAIRGAAEHLYNGVFTITVTTASEYTYTMNGDPVDTATGTITSTGVVLEGLTDSSGDVSAGRTFISDQDVRGRARKSSSSPRFKSFRLDGNTVDSANGLTINIRMILDE